MSVVTALAAAMIVYVFRGGAIGEINTLVEFYPMYGLLGEFLRAGELPRWNPYALSGTPLAADPQSGWLYLPVMITFGLFSLGAAAVLLSGLHLLLAGLGTFLLARVLGLPPVGATFAAIAYAFSGWYAQRMTCCPAGVATGAMLPVALLTAELALRAESSRRRLVWQLVSGAAAAQLAGAWFGQGAYYGLLAVGGYILYRTLIDPARRVDAAGRFRMLALHLAISGGAALGFAAGGLLPRFELYRISNLAGGYPVDDGGGWSWFRLTERLIGASSSHAGAVTIALAVFGLIVLRRRAAAPFWFGLILFAAIFSTDERTPVHSIFYALLPMFEQVQGQLPYRILFIAQLGLAMLAGGAAAEIARRRPARLERALLPMIGAGVLLYALWADERASTIGLRMLLPMAGVVVLALAATFAPERARQRTVRVVPVVLVIALIVDLAAFAHTANEESLDRGATARVGLGSYFEPAASARFLLEQPGGPFRYVGVDPSLRATTRSGPLLYGRQFADPMTASLIVNNRANLLGLEDIQGVNFPMHIGGYRDYFEALNDETQDYHNATLLSWEALDSPLLDLLNVRYIIVPQPHRSDQPPPESAIEHFREVYADEEVRILENPGAAPRAWIVHDVRSVEPGAVLELLASGAVDGRQVALIAGTDPADFNLAPSTHDAVTVTRDGSAALRVTAETDAPGLLIFSEIAHPGWRVTVDGRSAELLTVNHTLLGVAIPAGTHEIVLTFEARLLEIGLAITLATLLVAAGICGWLGRDARRKRREADPG